MASWDTPVVSAPKTADYAAPLVNFSAIANLPEDFAKGRQMAREEEKASLFRNGIPRVGGSTDPNAPIDVGQVTDKLARINPDYAMPLINTQIAGQQGQAAANAIMGPGGQQPAPAGQPAPSPRVVTPAPQGQSAQPGATTQQGDGPGSIVGVLSDAGVPNDQIGALAGRFAAALKVDPNTPLTKEQAALVLKRLEPIKNQIGAVVQPSQPEPAPQPQQTAQAAQPGSVQPQQPGNPSAWTQEEADSLSLRATRLNAYAAAIANVNPKAAEAAKAEASATEARATQIRNYIGEEEKTTNNQKDYNADKLPGETMADYQARSAAGSELGKQDSIAYSKKYEGIQKAAQEASIEQPKIQLMKTFSNDPNFYSGPLEPTNRGFKQFAATIGADPNKALPQEGFNKVASDMLTSQIRALGASGAGPVRIAEVKNMQKSIANLGITPVTNRLLVEITDRAYNDVKAIAELTRQHQLNPSNKPGKMNVTLDGAIQKYYDSHPLFSKEEIADPRMIAPPEFKDSRLAFNAKLPKGQPVKIDGKLKWVQ